MITRASLTGGYRIPSKGRLRPGCDPTKLFAVFRRGTVVLTSKIPGQLRRLRIAACGGDFLQAQVGAHQARGVPESEGTEACPEGRALRPEQPADSIPGQVQRSGHVGLTNPRVRVSLLDALQDPLSHRRSPWRDGEHQSRQLFDGFVQRGAFGERLPYSFVPVREVVTGKSYRQAQEDIGECPPAQEIRERGTGRTAGDGNQVRHRLHDARVRRDSQQRLTFVCQRMKRLADGRRELIAFFSRHEDPTTPQWGATLTREVQSVKKEVFLTLTGTVPLPTLR